MHFINTSEGWAVGASGTILHTTDGGANWSPQTSGTTESLLGVRAIDATVVWAAGARTLARTTDGGVNWGVAINPSPSYFINTIFPVSSTVAWSRTRELASARVNAMRWLVVWRLAPKPALRCSGVLPRTVVFVNAKFNGAFVMIEYFGYLQGDPDAGGYTFWLNKLNEFNRNFEQAEMGKAFIVSGEFRDRFLR